MLWIIRYSSVLVNEKYSKFINKTIIQDFMFILYFITIISITQGKTVTKNI
jgi:hypothetical protein